MGDGAKLCVTVATPNNSVSISYASDRSDSEYHAARIVSMNFGSVATPTQSYRAVAKVVGRQDVLLILVLQHIDMSFVYCVFGFSWSADKRAGDKRFTSCRRRCSRHRCTWVSAEIPAMTTAKKKEDRGGGRSGARRDNKAGEEGGNELLTCHRTGTSQSSNRCSRPGKR